MAAVVVYLLATLPPRPGAATGPVEDEVRRRTMAGAFHVHSTQSDGTADVDAIAAAAARAGLQFLVLTDHGDATAQPDPPTSKHGVLVIDAVEISTNGGHYVALDMPAAPYPLGGDAAAVVEDVRRLGGFGVAAHPDSAKPGLRWPDASLPVDGLEWLNLDSEWRDESRANLARVAFDYLLRPGPALASILDRPAPTLRRWDEALRTHAVVGFAAHDAHGGLSEGSRRGGTRVLLQLPSYEASFRTFAMRAVLHGRPTGDPASDARAVLEAFRRGRMFAAIDAIAAPAFVDFRLSSGGRDLEMGETGTFAEGARVSVASTLPEGGRIVLLRDGEVIAQSTEPVLQAPADAPGAYRTEVRTSDATAPWLLTNPISLRESIAPAVEPRAPEVTGLRPSLGVPHVEKDPLSSAAIVGGADRFTLEYRLRAGDRASQYAAVAVPMPGDGRAVDALVFDARASEPMRLSVQLRFDANGGSRWVSSVYVSPQTSRVVVPFSRLVSAGPAPASLPHFASASSVLFVVDLTNAKPGQSGTFDISGLALGTLAPRNP